MRIFATFCLCAAAVGLASPVAAQERDGPRLRVAAGLSEVYIDEHPFPMLSVSLRLPLRGGWSLEPEIRRDSHDDYGRTVVLVLVTHHTAGRRYVSVGAGRVGTDRFGANPGFATAVRVGWTYSLSRDVSIAPELGTGFPGFVVGGISLQFGR